jgi:hypothetical protein
MSAVRSQCFAKPANVKKRTVGRWFTLGIGAGKYPSGDVRQETVLSKRRYRAVAPVITPERKTWKGALLLPATNDHPAVYASGGRKLWKKKCAQVPLFGNADEKDKKRLFKYAADGEAYTSRLEEEELRDWRDQLHKTGRWAVRTVDTLTSRKRKAYLRRHPVKPTPAIVYGLALSQLEPVEIYP